jgi:hypothetical protein
MSQVDPDKVKEFLENPQTDSPAETVIDYDKIKKQMEEAEQEHKVSSDNIEEERSKMFESENAGLAHLNAWIHEKHDLKVEVTESDKNLYFKSLINDTKLELNINLEVGTGLSLTFRALNNYDLEIVFAALKQCTEEGNVTGTSQYATRVQQCAVALQLVKYNGVKVEGVALDYDSPMSVSITNLRNHIEKELPKWAWPKWQAVITGLKMFETKVSICNENIRNGNFWKPADSN